MDTKTKAIYNMLENEEDIKFDLIERFFLRDLTNDKDYEETVGDLAFVMEDELRSHIRFFLIDASMWGDIVMPFIEKANYREIADKWLAPRRERKLKERAEKKGKRRKR